MTAALSDDVPAKNTVSPPSTKLCGWVLTFSLLFACAAAAGAQTGSTLLHKPAPQFVLTDLQKGRVDLSAYRGKVVLLNFWATWCAPCKLEMPRFVEWQSRYGARGLEVVGISMDDDAAPVARVYEKLKLNYPVAMGDEKIGNLYGGILGLPVTFLIDAQGNIAAEYRGETDLGALEKQIETLLPGK